MARFTLIQNKTQKGTTLSKHLKCFKLIVFESISGHQMNIIYIKGGTHLEA